MTLNAASVPVLPPVEVIYSLDNSMIPLLFNTQNKSILLWTGSLRESCSSEDRDELNRKEFSEFLEIFRALNPPSNASIVANVKHGQTKLLSVLEIKTLPSLNYVEQGKLYTVDNGINHNRILDFCATPKRAAGWYSYLPKTYSLVHVFQLDLYFLVRDYEHRVVCFLTKWINAFAAFVKSLWPDEVEREAEAEGEEL